MKQLIKLCSVFIVCSLVPAIMQAQTCVGGFDPGCSPDDPCPCPIDNGLIVLIAGVILMAGYKAYQFKRKNLIA